MLNRNNVKTVRDLDITMETNPDGDFRLLSRDSAIRQSIKNLIMFEFDDVPYVNFCYTGLNSMVFDEFDILFVEKAKAKIKNIIKQFEQRAEFIDVEVEHKFDTVNLTVYYKIVSDSTETTHSAIVALNFVN